MNEPEKLGAGWKPRRAIPEDLSWNKILEFCQSFQFVNYLKE
jgi:hypothetical protein